MKQKGILLFTVAALFAALGCGSGGSGITGPVLDIDEALSLKIDQFYTAAGLEDEYATTGEFSVYLRDAVTGQDIACTPQESGMNRLGSIDLYYGGLDTAFTEVMDLHPTAAALVQLVFVEKDSLDCPEPIASGDDIIGITAPFTIDSLVATHIWASNGMASAVLRMGGTPPSEPPTMAFAMSDGLVVDQVKFAPPDDGNEHRYYLFAERYDGDTSAETCPIGDDALAKLRYGGIVYAALNLPVACFDPAAADFDATRVKFSVWVQKDAGPELMAETDVKTIGELIGERLDFTDGSGFVRLRNVSKDAFSARAARLEELTGLTLTTLTYPAAAAASDVIEVHLMDPAGYSVACTGAAQGLAGVAAPSTAYTGLSGRFTAVEGQRELFGWELLNLVVVGRHDGLACPAPMETDYTALGTASALEPLALKAGDIAFAEGGSATIVYAP